MRIWPILFLVPFVLACGDSKISPKSNSFIQQVKSFADEVKSLVVISDIETQELRRELAATGVAIVDVHGAPFFVSGKMKRGDTLKEACEGLLNLGMMEKESWRFFYDGLEFDPLELFEGVETECASTIKEYQEKTRKGSKER